MKLDRVVIITILLITQCTKLCAQYSRFSLDLNAGIPYTFASINGSISTYGSAGLRYNVSKALSAQLQFSLGTLRGEQTVAGMSDPSEQVSNYTNFSNNFYAVSGRAALNLERVFKLRRIMPRINPYLTGGVGYMFPDIVAKRVDGYERKFSPSNGVKPFYMGSVGLTLKYYMSPALDFNIGADYYIGANAYLDGLGFDKEPDSYVGAFIGVAYKFASSKSRQHVEWFNVVVKERVRSRERKKKKHDDTIPVIAEDKLEKPDSVIAGEPVKADTALAVKEEPPVVDEPAPAVEKEPAVVKQPTTTTTPVKTEPAPAGDKTPPVPAEAVKKEPAKETPVAQETSQNETIPALNTINGVVAPPARYNVIVGAYAGPKYAYIFRDKMRKKGYQAAIFKSDINSKILRVCIVTTESKAEAIRELKKARKTVDPGAWIHIYKGTE